MSDAAAALPPPRAGALVPLGFALLALFVPVRSASQAIYAGSFALALISMGLWGFLFARLFLRIQGPGPWTAVYLGQFALLAAAGPILTLNHLAAVALGRSLPLIAIVVPATAVVVARQVRTFRLPARVDLLALLGLGSVAVVVAVYSSHLGALGLDLHEHLAWVRQIVSRGFIPIGEDSTGIVGDYPRTFHLMTALWNAAGLTPPAGPFLNAMPFLQNALPLLALAEQAVELQAARVPADRRKWEIALALAFYAYVFLLIPMVYPLTDLSGTTRMSSGGLLLLPIVLVAIARAHQAPRGSLLAVATAPLLLAWTLSWHPVLVLALCGTVPVLIALWVAFKPPRIAQGSRRAHAATLALCGLLAVPVLVQDPWIVQSVAQRVPAAARLLERVGLVTFDEAVRRGLASAREKAVHESAAAPPCRDARCLLRTAGRVAGEALPVPWIRARGGIADLARFTSPSLPWLRDVLRDALPFPNALADYAGLPFVLFIFAAVLVWTVCRMRRPVSDAPRPGIAGRLLLASLVGMAMAGVGLAFAAGMAAALNDQRHESVILAQYAVRAAWDLSLSLLWLPFMASVLALLEPLFARAGPGPEKALPSRAIQVRVVAGLVLWLALPLAARLNLHRPLQHRGFRGRIGFDDLRALRAVEAAIPPADGVIIPAEHVAIADWEHWVLPLGDTGALLPYGERRYLFNFYTGASYPFSWRDRPGRRGSSCPLTYSRQADAISRATSSGASMCT